MQKIRIIVIIIQLLAKGYSLRSISPQMPSLEMHRIPLKRFAHCLMIYLPGIVHARLVIAALIRLVAGKCLKRSGCICELKGAPVSPDYSFGKNIGNNPDPCRYTQFCILLKQGGKITMLVCTFCSHIWQYGND